jgi:Polyketide cyclase / dehydrase and lipid transport
MASIHRETIIDVDPAQAWDALRDWGALHERLARGFAVDVRLDGQDRIVTFAGGAVLREVLVDRDEERRRLAWAIVDGPYTHHHGVAQVHDADGGRTRFTWTSDLLPDALEGPTADSMDQGLAAIRATLEGSPG